MTTHVLQYVEGRTTVIYWALTSTTLTMHFIQVQSIYNYEKKIFMIFTNVTEDMKIKENSQRQDDVNNLKWVNSHNTILRNQNKYL